LPEVVVELTLELSVCLRRPGEHQMLEPPTAPQREQPVGDVPEMARPMVVHVALHPHLRSAALIVPTGDVVGDAGHLLDLAHLHDEQPRLLVVHESEAAGSVGLEHDLERQPVSGPTTARCMSGRETRATSHNPASCDENIARPRVPPRWKSSRTKLDIASVSRSTDRTAARPMAMATERARRISSSTRISTSVFRG
jgi:hypothetical protein